MDAYEATKTVLSRIQSLDPENASKIMGYILIQDQGEKEMIRLAFGPETLLISVMNHAKTRLGLSSNSLSAPSTPLPFTSVSNATKFNPFLQSSPRISIPNNGFAFGFGFPTSPRLGLSSSSSSAPSTPWSNGSPVFTRSPRPVSYASVVNGSASNDFGSNQVQEHMSFDHPIMSPSGRSDSVGFCEENSSVNDGFLDDNNDNNNGFGVWRPCMYYARGFCKNGESCKFVHDDNCVFDGGDSPEKMDCFYDEILRMKALQHHQQQQQQRFAAAQFMASGPRHSPFAYNKCMNFLNENQRSAAAAMMNEEFHRYGVSRPDRAEFSNSTSRQIYLTFPADSTFKEEDVSNYFSMYGPVQDVRIPYQQKRMFGFVTFVYPETVKLILAKGNPHFVCDSRVLVKPYKEKGKMLDRKLMQQPLDSAEFSACLSPTGLESRELHNIPFGARMFHNSHGMMLRRRLEQDAQLQQAIELQGRRLMNLQLMDMKNREALAENNCIQEPSDPTAEEADEKLPDEVQNPNNENGSSRYEQTLNTDDFDPLESFELTLPDNLFASPTKSAAERHVGLSSDVSSPIAPPAAATATSTITTTNNVPVLPTASTFNMASLKSCYFQMPRFASGQETTET